MFTFRKTSTLLALDSNTTQNTFTFNLFSASRLHTSGCTNLYWVLPEGCVDNAGCPGVTPEQRELAHGELRVRGHGMELQQAGVQKED